MHSIQKLIQIQNYFIVSVVAEDLEVECRKFISDFTIRPTLSCAFCWANFSRKKFSNAILDKIQVAKCKDGFHVKLYPPEMANEYISWFLMTYINKNWYKYIGHYQSKKPVDIITYTNLLKHIHEHFSNINLKTLKEWGLERLRTWGGLLKNSPNE